jgi:hypothetical protein
MPFARRRRSIGAWHHNIDTGAFTGAKAINTVSSSALTPTLIPTDFQGTIAALSLDLSGIDPTNNFPFSWGLLVKPNGIAFPADPTTSDQFQSLYWLYGEEKNTTSYGYCLHVNPRTKRRLQAGDGLVFFVKYHQPASANNVAVLRYDFHARQV